MSKFIGIDISKQTFDVCFFDGEHQKFDNNLKGFKKLLRKLNTDNKVVMEASGPYYVKLASFLYHESISVFVVNPLKIKRFSQMNFNRAKTDKKDAKLIRDFSIKMEGELKKWQPDSEHVVELKQLNTSVELLNKQINQLKLQMQSFEDSGHIAGKIKKGYKKILRNIQQEKENLEAEMERITKEEYAQTVASLTSIPGIGIKTATMLIAITDDFRKFEHYKQLIAYVGFSPRIYQSGTSVKGKGHICKMGKSQIRKLLYLCSWSAKKYNKACREMYERLKKRGKPERVIKIAIANKLLKTCFAIAKSGGKYKVNYLPKVCY